MSVNTESQKGFPWKESQTRKVGFLLILWLFFMLCCVKGVLESFLGTAVTGAIFCLLAGQPLTILSSTGPVLVFERLLFNFSRCVIISVQNVTSQTNYCIYSRSSSKPNLRLSSTTVFNIDKKKCLSTKPTYQNDFWRIVWQRWLH